MINSWLRLPIYFNGVKCFDAIPSGDLTVVDAFERMYFISEKIEHCLAEGRLLDEQIYYRLEDLGDHVRRNEIPPFNEITDLLDRISTRYGFEIASRSNSMWIRRDKFGQHAIWIDQDRIIAESNKRLFG